MDLGHKSNVHLIGNAHVDPVWLWTWQEGFAEIKATFRSALDRMKEFPEFIFTSACASYYRWVEENDPEMFEEIRERVAEGRWAIAGGWWVQPDCNLPSGESFARHALYSQRYFLEKFGVQATVGYNVDSFGHHGMMPQILQLCGLDSYVFMRPMKHEKTLPSNLFWWESADGSRVLTFRLSDGYTVRPERDLSAHIMKHRDQALADGFPHMSFYGVGNHGGGPTIANLKEIVRLKSSLAEDDIAHSRPDAYFREVRAALPELPVIRDDLQYHAIGCYSAHSEVKLLNRRAEHRLYSAEVAATLAEAKLGLAYPREALQNAWEQVLFNQFHDTLGGCSIKEAYDDAREAYGESLNIGARTLNAAMQKISWAIDTMKPGVGLLTKEKDFQVWEQGDAGTPFVVFNPLAWEVSGMVRMNKRVASVTDQEGSFVPTQTVRASRTDRGDKWDTLFPATVPAFGYRVYWAYLTAHPESSPQAGSLRADQSNLENDFVRIELDPASGRILRYLDKRLGADLIGPGGGAVPLVIDESHSDTWGHGLEEYRDVIGAFGDATVRVLEAGPLRAVVRVTSRYGRSVLRQDLTLTHDSPELGVSLRVDWQEQRKMLKLSFDLSLDEPEAFYEIPYGFIQKEANGKEVPGHRWAAVQGRLPGGNGRAGMALINDAKYSYDALQGDLRMTVVRSPGYAEHFGEFDEQMEYMDQGFSEVKYKLSPYAGDWRDNEIVRKAWEWNVPLLTMWETYHAGPLGQISEDIAVSSEQVVVSALKPAEAKDGWILRCYETAGKSAGCSFRLPALGRSWDAEFRACEIKTFFLPADAARPVEEVNFIEQP